MQSNEGDEYVVEMSVADSSSNELFNSKKSVMITDSSNGQFQGGQIQFDLSTLASQSSWASLNDAVIEFPISITATQTAAGTAAANGGVYSAILKNGFSQWIDSVQLVINGQTVQSAQTYENIAAQFRILSQWSQDTLVKYGASCGFVLDDLTGGHDAASGQRSLASVPLSRVTSNQRGLDTITSYDTSSDTGNGPVFRNQGALKRARMLNQTATPANSGTPSLMSAILGANVTTSGQSNVATAEASPGDTNRPVFTQYMMATVRLSDLCDISQFPLVKNLRGYLYLTCNQFDVACGATTVTPNLQSGRTNPFMINIGTTATAPYGMTLATGSGVVTYRGRIGNQTTITPLGGSAPVITNGRFIIPTYEANPTVDAILTRSAHEFRTLDKLVDPFTVAANGSVNRTITVGIPNATRLVLLPMYTKIGGVQWDPEWAPFDSTPATSSPFAYLRDLQVQLGGKSVFNTPIQYDYEAWMAEISKTGRDGGEDVQTSSGLLSQFDWSLNHRYYTVDLSRRLDSEDNSSKSVQVTFTNPSSTYEMKVIAIVFFEKKWLINTATCALQNIG